MLIPKFVELQMISAKRLRSVRSFVLFVVSPMLFVVGVENFAVLVRMGIRRVDHKCGDTPLTNALRFLTL